MTLHEAIVRVLLDANTPLSSGEIADAINNQKLYKRRDGQKLASSQIMARVNQYPDLLKANGEGKIQIINRELHGYRLTFYHILNLLRNSRIQTTEARLIAATTVFISWARIDASYKTDNFFKSGFIPHITSVLKGYDKTNLFDVFLSLLNKLTDVEVFRVFEAMHPSPSVEKVDPKTFGSFFNEIINEYTSSSDWQVGGFSTPRIISKFVSSIFKVGYRAKIFDPFVGFGGTLAQAFRFNVERDPRIVAGDVDEIALSLARLNLLANGCDSTYFYHKNAFSEWGNSIEADLIVTVPPFGLKTSVNELYSTHRNLLLDLGLFNSSVTVDSSVAGIIIALSHLNRHGKAVIVVPDGFLFSTRNDIKFLRQYLVDRRLIAGVIALPAGSFKPYASVSCSLIILNTETTENNRLFICDASKYNLESFGQNIDWIARAYRGEVVGTDAARFISYNEVVVSNYYDLSPKRYLAFNIAIYGEDYSLLREVTSSISSGIVVSKTNINRNSGLPFIQIGDLIDSSGLNEIDISNVEYFISDIGQLGRHRAYIPDRAVLVSKIGTKLKPTLYKYAGDALCNANVLVIKTNENELLPEYLITQLQSDYVLRQIESVRHDVGVPHTSVASFRDVRIKMLPIEEQRRFVASYYGKKLKEETQSTERKREDDLYNIISTLKHELKQPVSSIGMDIKTVKDFLSKQIDGRALISWSDPVVERLQGQTDEDLVDFHLSKIFERLETCIVNAQSTLAKAEETLNIGSNVFTPERVGIKKFLESTLLPLYVNECCKINLLGHEHEVIIDKYQIGILFRRLIENAIKHGFKGRDDKQQNVINIKLVGRTSDREFLEIVVENNGKPFPDGFDTSKFQTKGLTTNRSSGSGFGGFQIKQIIDNHKGEFAIASKEEIGESEFKVKFKIYLPCQ